MGLSAVPTMSDVEDRAGVDRIDDLLARRDVIVRELAALRPLYGPLGLWNHQRKVELARLEVLIRAQAAEANPPRKLTEATVDAEAHAHSDYIAMVAQATMDAARWVVLEENLSALDMRINRGQALIRYASTEPRT